MDEHKKRKIELIVGGVSLIAFLVALAVQLTATRYAEKLPLVTNLPFSCFLISTFSCSRSLSSFLFETLRSWESSKDEGC